ncbi:flagellar hook assembly protein FlgD [bacterium]|nr:flagellar hook assembly protein FlgD [bacterium]MBU1752672.1 flagellar hook assembly protein FlgD [bacterium]
MADVAAITGATTQASTAAATNVANILGKDDFLKLLTTQLRYQNPLEPMENTEFISQMAQFTSLEQMANLNENFKNLSTTLGSIMNKDAALAFLGKKVIVNDAADPNKTVESNVKGIDYQSGVPKLILDMLDAAGKARTIGMEEVLGIVS